MKIDRSKLGWDFGEQKREEGSSGFGYQWDSSTRPEGRRKRGEGRREEE